MATVEEEKIQRDRLDGILNNIVSTKIDDLVQRDKLGQDLNFEEAIPFFNRVLSIYQKMREVKLDVIPHSSLQALVGQGQNTITLFNRIRALTPKQGNAFQTRVELINSIRDSYDVLFSIFTPIIAYSDLSNNKLSATLTEASIWLNNIKEMSKDHQNYLEDIKSKSKNILNSMREAAAESGVSQHAVHFKNEAASHKRVAYVWLGFLAFFGLIALKLSYDSIIFYMNQNIEMPTSQSIHLGIAKLIAFSILYFGLIWTSRNYRAHRHNFVVNKHRQNALSTFQEFVNGTADTQTKNAVLLKATESIFSQNATGYLTKEPEPQGGTQILEVIRNVMGKQQ